MNSSTFSSEAGRPAQCRALQIVLVVLVILSALEYVTRAWLFEASKDFSRFRTYEGRAASLADARGIRIAFVGNSAAEEGVDVERFAAGLSERIGRPVNADVFAADGSQLGTWRYMIERYFWKTGRNVDLIVIPFFGRGLADGDRMELGRLAQFFTAVDDWSEVLSVDLRDRASRFEFIVSSFWATYASRERIRERLFSVLFAGYKSYIRESHAGLMLRRGESSALQSFARLDRVLALAARHGTALCFVALPTRGGTRDEEAAGPGVERLGALGACYKDLRKSNSLEREDFADEIHLAKSGRVMLTDRLVAEFASMMQLTHTESVAEYRIR